MPVINEIYLNDVTCFGASNGEIQVEATGDTPPYQYTLVGQGVFNTTGLFTGLAPGLYSIVASDSTIPIPITSTAYSFSVSQPTELEATADVTGQTVTITATGGTAPYQYSIDGGALQAGNVFDPVDYGSHTILVVDDNGCQVSIPIIVDPEPTYGTITGTVRDLITIVDYNVDCVSGVAPCHPLRFCVDMDTDEYLQAVINNDTAGDYYSNLSSIKVYVVDTVPDDLATLTGEETQGLASIDGGLCYTFIAQDAWINTTKQILFVYTFQLTIPTDSGNYTYFDRIGFRMSITVKDYDDGTNITATLTDDQDAALETVCAEYNDTINICYDTPIGGNIGFVSVLHIDDDLFSTTSTILLDSHPSLTLTDGDITDGQACVQLDTTQYNASSEICLKGVISTDGTATTMCGCMDLTTTLTLIQLSANQVEFSFEWDGTNATGSTFVGGNFWVTSPGGVQFLTTTLPGEDGIFPSLFLTLPNFSPSLDVHMDFTYEDGCTYTFEFTLDTTAGVGGVLVYMGTSCDPTCAVTIAEIAEICDYTMACENPADMTATYEIVNANGNVGAQVNVNCLVMSSCDGLITNTIVSTTAGITTISFENAAATPLVTGGILTGLSVFDNTSGTLTALSFVAPPAAYLVGVTVADLMFNPANPVLWDIAVTTMIENAFNFEFGAGGANFILGVTVNAAGEFSITLRNMHNPPGQWIGFGPGSGMTYDPDGAMGDTIVNTPIYSKSNTTFNIQHDYNAPCGTISFLDVGVDLAAAIDETNSLYNTVALVPAVIPIGNNVAAVQTCQTSETTLTATPLDCTNPMYIWEEETAPGVWTPTGDTTVSITKTSGNFRVQMSCDDGCTATSNEILVTNQPPTDCSVTIASVAANCDFTIALENPTDQSNTYEFSNIDDSSNIRATAQCIVTDSCNGEVSNTPVTLDLGTTYLHLGNSYGAPGSTPLLNGGLVTILRVFDTVSGGPTPLFLEFPPPAYIVGVNVADLSFDPANPGLWVTAFTLLLQNALNDEFGAVAGVNYELLVTADNAGNFDIRFTNRHNPAALWVGLGMPPQVSFKPDGTGTNLNIVINNETEDDTTGVFTCSFNTACGIIEYTDNIDIAFVLDEANSVYDDVAFMGTINIGANVAAVQTCNVGMTTLTATPLLCTNPVYSWEEETTPGVWTATGDTTVSINVTTGNYRVQMSCDDGCTATSNEITV